MEEVSGKNDIKRNIIKQSHNEQIAQMRKFESFRNRVGQLEKKIF